MKKVRYSESLAKRNGNSFSGDGRHWFERNDCSVIAFAYAFDLPYEKAHSICKKAGRIDCHGFNLSDVLRVNKHKKSRQFLGRRVGYHGRPKKTVGRFQKSHPKGIYIIRVGNHIFTMIDGNCLNQNNVKDIISYYYYVSKPKTNETDNQNKPECVGNTETVLQDSQAIKAECSEPNEQRELGILAH